MATTRKSSPELANLKIAAKELQGHQVKVGYLEAAHYPARGKTPALPVAYIAAIQELGYPEGGIPPRSYMRSTIAERSGEWGELMASGARAIVKGNATAGQVLKALGQTVAGDMQRTLADLQEPPLKRATLKARRNRKEQPNSSTKPLVDRYQQLKNINSVVEKT